MTLNDEMPPWVRDGARADGLQARLPEADVGADQRHLLRPRARDDVGRVEQPRRGLRHRLVSARPAGRRSWTDSTQSDGDQRVGQHEKDVDDQRQGGAGGLESVPHRRDDEHHREQRHVGARQPLRPCARHGASVSERAPTSSQIHAASASGNATTPSARRSGVNSAVLAWK